MGKIFYLNKCRFGVDDYQEVSVEEMRRCTEEDAQCGDFVELRRIDENGNFYFWLAF